jgi:NAD(P)-dependent dehydrogenase (short-subunit alcohol dehydrogenase family)
MTPQNPLLHHKFLITGGTSGLGLELVRLFLESGHYVVATGRQPVHMPDFPEQFTFCRMDFGDLDQVSVETRKLCRDHSITHVINNAGILSPPAYTTTADGHEYTFQINFLSHLLINEIILSCSGNRQLRIAAVTSPVYRFASIFPVKNVSAGYIPLRSYSSSKLYMALMNEFITFRHGKVNHECFSFDPGTFSSGIYRMQNRWFRAMYRVAAPFMRSPVRVAKVLADLILSDNISNGAIYDISGRQKSFPVVENTEEALFDSCYKLIDPFLRQSG